MQEPLAVLPGDLFEGLQAVGGEPRTDHPHRFHPLLRQRREALVQAINAYEGAVILVSHDRHLVEATTDRLMIVGDGTIREFDGDLDDYRRLVLEGSSGAKSEERAGEDDGSRVSALDRRRAAAALREKLAPLRKKIKKLRQEKAIHE